MAHLSLLGNEEDIAIVVLITTIHIRLKFQEVQQLGNLETIEATWLASDPKKTAKRNGDSPHRLAVHALFLNPQRLISARSRGKGDPSRYL